MAFIEDPVDTWKRDQLRQRAIDIAAAHARFETVCRLAKPVGSKTPAPRCMACRKALELRQKVYAVGNLWVCCDCQNDQPRRYAVPTR